MICWFNPWCIFSTKLCLNLLIWTVAQLFGSFVVICGKRRLVFAKWRYVCSIYSHFCSMLLFHDINTQKAQCMCVVFPWLASVLSSSIYSLLLMLFFLAPLVLCCQKRRTNAPFSKTCYICWLNLQYRYYSGYNLNYCTGYSFCQSVSTDCWAFIFCHTFLSWWGQFNWKEHGRD